MSGWLQLAVALVSATGGILGAYWQFVKRTPPHSDVPQVPGKRRGLNGFASILREAMEQMDQLKQENEQLRIRIAELEAQATVQAAAKRPARRSSRSKATT